MLAYVENYGGMPAATPVQTRKLYLSEWLARLRKRPVDLARHLGVTESYISNLKSDKRGNPSITILIEMSEFLGVTVNDLTKPPPRAATIEQLQGYSQAAVQQLLTLPAPLRE